MLKAFESSVYAMIRKVAFNKCTNKHQEVLKRTITRINDTKELIVAADKTRNFYKVKPEQYVKMRQEDITKEYKRAERIQVDEVNAGAAKIAENLQLDDRMRIYQENEAFITIKDHKDQFPSVVKRRLINPAKSDIGRVSKQILQTINLEIIKKTGLKLCRSTGEVLEWYKSTVMESVEDMSFVVYDIADYYPSISKKLLTEALKFAAKHTEIKEEHVEIILQARKTFLFCEKEPWVKKDSNGNFDVPQGSFDSCEVCELCGLFLLAETSSFVPTNNNILYRDDGLIALKATGRELDKIRQKLVKTYGKFGLKLVVTTNVKIVEYLDIKLNSNNKSHRAYKKPNDTPIYVNSQSNHPPAVIKSIPESINNRLNMLACNETVFEEDKEVYQEALKKAGYKYKLNYTHGQSENKRKTRDRARDICWFNPPWSHNVKTPVGKMFLELLDLHFPRSHPLHKKFNRNTVKMSYCTCRNLGNHITSHNKKVLQPKVKQKDTCNCKNKFKNDCPLPGQCTTSNIVYQAEIEVEGSDEKKKYFGQTSRPFKQRYYEHKMAMNNMMSKHATALSRYIWKIKNAGKQFKIKWSIKNRAQSLQSGSKKCQLCLKEKTAIALCKPEELLNSRTELLAKCIHLINFELRKAKKVPP